MTWVRHLQQCIWKSRDYVLPKMADEGLPVSEAYAMYKEVRIHFGGSCDDFMSHDDQTNPSGHGYPEATLTLKGSISICFLSRDPGRDAHSMWLPSTKVAYYLWPFAAMEPYQDSLLCPPLSPISITGDNIAAGTELLIFFFQSIFRHVWKCYWFSNQPT